MTAATDTKPFDGDFLLWRKAGKGLARATSKSRPPRFRHPTFASAETEAQRLLGEFPESSFVILQEVARVKVKPASEEPKRPAEGDSAQVFEDHAAWVRETEALGG